MLFHQAAVDLARSAILIPMGGTGFFIFIIMMMVVIIMMLDDDGDDDGSDGDSDNVKWILTLPDQQFLFPWVALAFDQNQMMMIMLIILKVLLTFVMIVIMIVIVFLVMTTLMLMILGQSILQCQPISKCSLVETTFLLLVTVSTVKYSHSYLDHE